MEHILGVLFFMVLIGKALWLIYKNQAGEVKFKVVIGLILFELVTVAFKFHGGRGLDDYGVQLMHDPRSEIGNAFREFMDIMAIGISTLILITAIAFITFFFSKYEVFPREDSNKEQADVGVLLMILVALEGVIALFSMAASNFISNRYLNIDSSHLFIYIDIAINSLLLMVAFIDELIMGILYIILFPYLKYKENKEKEEEIKRKREEIIKAGPYKLHTATITREELMKVRKLYAFKEIKELGDGKYYIVYIDKRDAYNPDYLKMIAPELLPLNIEARDLLVDGKLLRYDNIPFNSFYMIVNGERVRLDRFLQNKHNINLVYNI